MDMKGIYQIIHIFLMFLLFPVTEQLQGSFKTFKNSGFPSSTVFLKEKLGGFDITTRSAMHCGTLCMYTKTCIGYFFKENEFCRLVSSVKSDVLISTPGTTYYQLQDACMLYQNPCNAGQCTTTNKIDPLYACQCPDGVTGENCNEAMYYVDNQSKDAQYGYNGNCASAAGRGVQIYFGRNRFTLVYRLKMNGLSYFNKVISAKMYLTIKKMTAGINQHDIKIKAMKRVDSTTDLEQCTDFIHDNLRTTAEVIWNGPHGPTQVGDVIETPDLSSLLNEVIGMDGWQAGNHVDIVFFNDDLPDTSSGESSYFFYSGVDGIEVVPKLVVSFR